MERVTGIGGMFFRAKDPEALAAWYEDMLGITQVPGDYNTPPWAQGSETDSFCSFSNRYRLFRQSTASLDESIFE
jgi:hypothetical protein